MARDRLCISMHITFATLASSFKLNAGVDRYQSIVILEQLCVVVSEYGW